MGQRARDSMRAPTSAPLLEPLLAWLAAAGSGLEASALEASILGASSFGAWDLAGIVSLVPCSLSLWAAACTRLSFRIPCTTSLQGTWVQLQMIRKKMGG